MAQRVRNAGTIVRHNPQSSPPPPYMVGQVPIDAQELSPGVIDDVSKIVNGVLTPDLINPLTTPGQPSINTHTEGITSDGRAYETLTWLAVTYGSTYEIRYKLHTDTVYSYVRTANLSYTIYGLVPNLAYDFSVQAVTALGVASGYPADTTITSAKDTTGPATPASVTASAGVRTVIVAFTANTEPDLDHYVIEIYSDAGLTTLVKTFTGLATVWAYDQGTAQTQYWARVKAVDTSGNSSAWSATVTATTGQIANSDIQAGTITADRLVAATITAASGVIANAAIGGLQVQDASISDAKIVELSADKITGGTIQADLLLSGNIRTADAGQRVVIDASGIKLYNNAGRVTVNLDAGLGSGYFEGSIAASTFKQDDGSLAMLIRAAEGGANGGEFVWAASASAMTQAVSKGFISLTHTESGLVDAMELHVGKDTGTDSKIIIQGASDSSIQSVQLIPGANNFTFLASGAVTGILQARSLVQKKAATCTWGGANVSTPTVSVTWDTAMSAAPFLVSNTNGNSGQPLRSKGAVGGQTSTGASVAATTTDNVQPVNGTTAQVQVVTVGNGA